MNIYQVSRIVFIAVIYLVLTLAFAPLSYGPIQVRFAEALTILPYLIPEGIWGGLFFEAVYWRISSVG